MNPFIGQVFYHTQNVDWELIRKSRELPFGKTYIYSLDDENGIPFYIGKTVNLHLRFYDHIRRREVVRENRFYYPNQPLTVADKMPYVFTINIIDIVDSKEWQLWERFYISLFKTFGFNLVNKYSGGLKNKLC